MAPALKDLESGSPKKEAHTGVVPSSETDLGQAYKDLVRGEQAAAALEANLTNLEHKLDDMLAAFEAAEAKQKLSGSGQTDEGQDKTQTRPEEKKS